MNSRISLFIVSVISTALFVSCGAPQDSSSTPSSKTSSVSSDVQTSVQPDRKVDLYGKIVSIEWNELTISETDTSKDPTFNMSSEEKKKYMQSMDEAERMALKATINNSTIGNVKTTVPVGIPMVRKTAQGPDAPNAEASLSDLKVGQYVSIWYSTASTASDRSAEFVKIAFSQ